MTLSKRSKAKRPEDPDRALRQYKERLESLLELSSDWYWEQDENCRFTLVVGTRVEQTGSEPQQYLGTARWDHGAVPVGDGGSWDKHKADLEARRPFADFVFKRLDPRGDLRYISTTGQPVFDAKKRFKGYRGTASDVTRRVQIELRLAIEHAVTRVLAESNSIAEATPQIIRVICETLEWSCGARWEPDEGAEAIRCAETWGVAAAGIAAFLEATRRQAPSTQPGGLTRRAWTEGKPLWIRDVTKEATFRRAPDALKAELRSAFAFPIRAGAQVVGVMEFFSREIHPPDAELLDCTNFIGSQIGQFFQRRRAEEEQRRFRAAMDASADLMLLIDPVSLRYVDVNDAACRALGYSREELLRMGPPDIFSMSREEFTRLYERMIAGELSALTVKGHYRRKDGSKLPVEAYPRALRSGEGHVIVSIARDLSERLAAEEALRESEERFQGTIELAAIGIAHVDAEGKFIYVNQWLCELLGYTREQLLGLTVKQISHPDDKVATDAIRAELWAGRINSFRLEKRYLRKDGTVVWVGLKISVKRGASDEPLHDISVVEDISARKQAEEALRQSEERFRGLTALSSDLYWEQDDQYRFTSMKGIGTDRVNMGAGRPAVGKKRWEQNYINMTADDWAAHRVILDARQPFVDLELCRLDESGKKVWVGVSGEPVFDQSGVFKGYRGVGKDITVRKLVEERVQHLAHHDELTSLPNRTMFGEMLNLEIQQARRHKRSFAVLFIDLDRFKVINDTLGHAAGDTLLREIATRLTQTLRLSDVIARLGGDEFVMLAQDVNEAKYIATVARKILSAVIKPMFIQGQECRVTASIGICMYPADAQDEQSLMKNADIAMYRAKEEGKNTYQFFSQEMNVHTFERMALETSLRCGLERNEFFLHYQAKLDLKTRRITGVEALVRWQHPDLGMIPPAQFIPLAEETGLIVPLRNWVLNTACAQNVAWQREGLPPLGMAVNLSARQLSDENLLKDIAEALERSGMKAELLELELTESMVMQNADRAGKVLAALKQLGTRLAIDDFGVGYSSLANLKRFPIDTLKVDRSFIRDIPQDAEDKAITRAIIAMGKTLNLTVVAEGVETLEQEMFLREHACDETQGYYFSKPIASDRFAELLRLNVASHWK